MGKRFQRFLSYSAERNFKIRIIKCPGVVWIPGYFYPNGSPYNRLGITAGKKQGCAVTRNRIKRIVRAAYRLNEAEFPLGYDIVFVGRNDIGEKKTQDIERFIKKRLIREMNKPVPKNNRSGRAKRK